jgi:hypothetical protein
LPFIHNGIILPATYLVEDVMDHKQYLIDHLKYVDGALFWVKGRRAGKRADLLNKTLGYKRVRFSDAPYKQVSYWAHRVVWLLHHGDWPVSDIDHINGDRSDNKIENLRLASRSENNINRPAVSGYKGVRYHKPSGKWQARITKEYKEKHLGLFETEIEAAKAYDEAAKVLHGGFATLNFH